MGCIGSLCFLSLCAMCRLVQEYPERALSWFAVGCYYLCTQQFESARMYFGKATTLESSFAPAWIGFGNAFAAQDESDQVRQFCTSVQCKAGHMQGWIGTVRLYRRARCMSSACRQLYHWKPLSSVVLHSGPHGICTLKGFVTTSHMLA